MVMCWAPNCTHYNVREECKFYRFPTDAKLRKRWLKLLRRDDTPGPGARVCSCHFEGGDKEKGPTIYKHNIGKAFKSHYLSPEKKKPRKKFPLQILPSTSFGEQNISHAIDVQPSTSGTCGPADEEKENITENVMVERTQQTEYVPSNVALEIENQMLKEEIEKNNVIINQLSVQFSYTHIQKKDKLVLLYTGLPTSTIFESLDTLLQKVEITYYLKWRVVKLSRTDQLLMTLMKLRHNFPHEDLALRFNVSQATVSNILITHVHLMHEILFKQFMKEIPSRNKNMSCLPNCFSSFTNCRIILDCTELYTAVPRESMAKQKQTYSSYKHRNTWKGLIGVAPNGVITYVSKLYPGSTSDKKIVQSCGILEQLLPGDLVLADKGFLIRDLLPAGVSLNIPPFLTTSQFATEQVQRTECIARARIHVERAIQRMKVFGILDFIPETLLSYATIIFQVVAALTNLQYPLLKEVEQCYNYE